MSDNTGLGSVKAKFKSAEFVRPQHTKMVFCIDNVSRDADISSVRQFIVDDLGVNVVSLFEVKPRRRSFDLEGQYRRAYRVCIHVDDVDRFLREDKWPDHVNVFEWFFKSDSFPSSRKATAPTAQIITLVLRNDRSSTMMVQEVSQRGSSNIFNVLSSVDSVSAHAADTIAAVVTVAAGPLGPQPVVSATSEPFVNNGGVTEWSAEMDADDSVQEINLSTAISELGDSTVVYQSNVIGPHAEVD